MKISCDKAAEICTKSQYEEASSWQILKLKFHLFFCKNCAKFSAKNATLTGLCESADLKTLDLETKEAMKSAIKNEL